MAQRSELAPGIFVLQERLEQPTRIKYDVANESDARLDMAIDLSGSENVAFANGEHRRQVLVEPNATRYVGTVFVSDPSRGWRLATKFNWTATRKVPASEAAPHSDADADANCEDRNRVRLPEGGDRLPRAAHLPGAKGPTAPQPPQITRKELEPNLFIVRSQYESPTRFTFTLENNLDLTVELTIDLSDSTNIVAADGTRKLTVEVLPESTREVGVVHVVTEGESWSLSTRYGWKKKQPPVDYLKAKAAKDSAKVQATLEAYAKSPLYRGDDGLSIQDLIAKCKQHKVRFIDTEFLPEESSLYEPNSPYKDPNLPLSWRSAGDIFPDGYSIFEKGIEPNDIKQGRLGDCWLMCSLSSLAEFPSAVRSIFQVKGSQAPQAVNDAGVYEVRICKHGEWHVIRLDDHFPCFPGGGPVYSRANGPELWVMLLEKAFAKLAGCYDMLRGGLAYEALMDLTGCPTSSYSIEDTPPNELWELLEREDKNDNIMSASVTGEDKWSQVEGRSVGGPGLVSGHAYTLQQAKRSRAGHRLICLRNPWGEVEWTGDYSDNSPLWTPELKAEINPTLKDGDGLFWMSFEDFIKHFHRVNICHTNATSGQRWMECRHKGLVRYTDTGVQCPYFSLRVPHDTELWISMHQDDERMLHAQPYIDLDFIIVRDNGPDAREVVKRIHGMWDRQTQLHIPKLPAGNYLALPYTSNILRQRKINRPAESILDSRGHLTKTYLQLLWEVFRRYDDDMDSSLNFVELAAVLRDGRNEAVSKEKYAEYTKQFDSNDGGLSRDGFVALVTEAKPPAIREMLTAWGYDEMLRLTHQRGFVISVHSETHVTLSKYPFDPAMFRLAMSEMMKEPRTRPA